jgi:uncharacterized protein
MNQASIIQQTNAFIRSKLEGEGSGHDWWHIDRVRNTALRIATDEKADAFVIELGALLHDIADWKFHNGDTEAGPQAANEWLTSINTDHEVIDHVSDIVRTISFKGAGVQTTMKTLEGMIVQDADRLDALGAIGIARAFAYGGSKQRPMHDPTIQAEPHQTFEAYQSSNGTTINHFYEKLLLLKDRMNTNAGRKLAEERHRYMEGYLKEFYREWNGEA